MRFGIDKTALFVARRYLFSKKEHNIINVISGVSAVGIMVSTAALVVVLSVFNGMSEIIGGWFNQLHSDFEITAAEGKSFRVDSFPLSQVEKMPGVAHVYPIVCDLALVSYESRQELLYLKGVPDGYFSRKGLDRMLVDGEASMQRNNIPCAVLGAGAAGKLQINLNSFEALKLYYPVRTKKNFSNAAESFSTRHMIPDGVLATNTNYDEDYLFCSIDFVRDLMNYPDEVTSFEVALSDPGKYKRFRSDLESTVGDRFVVKDKYQQEESLYRTMKSEKLIIFLILALILVLASFNIIGALGMLIIEKQHDVGIMNGLGASRGFVRRVFIYEGNLISLAGSLLGVLLGALICFLQQTFHIVKLGGGGNYIIPYYPVQLRLADVLVVIATVLAISAITSIIPAYQLKKQTS